MTSPEDDNLEEALRRALAEAASEVEPGTDGLDKIRARTAGRPPRPWLSSVLIGVVDRVRHWTWRGHWAWRDPLRSLRARRWGRSRRSNFPRRGIGWVPLVTAVTGVSVLAGIAFGIQPIRQEILHSTTLNGGGDSPQANSGVAGNGVSATGENGTSAASGALSSQQTAHGSSSATSTHSPATTARPLSGAGCTTSPPPVTTTVPTNATPTTTPTATDTGTTPAASATASATQTLSPTDSTSPAASTQPYYAATATSSCSAVTPTPSPSLTPPTQTPSPSPSSTSASPIATPLDSGQSTAGSSGTGSSGTGQPAQQQTGNGATQSTTGSGKAAVSTAGAATKATKATKTTKTTKTTSTDQGGPRRPDLLSQTWLDRHDRGEHRGWYD